MIVNLSKATDFNLDFQVNWISFRKDLKIQPRTLQLLLWDFIMVFGLMMVGKWISLFFKSSSSGRVSMHTTHLGPASNSNAHLIGTLNPSEHSWSTYVVAGQST